MADRVGESAEHLGGGEADPDRDPREEEALARRRVPPRRRGVDGGPGLAGDEAPRGDETMKYRNWKDFFEVNLEDYTV